MTLEQALARLKAAGPLLAQYGVARAGVFGSVARGDNGPDSDLDVLVEFEPGRAPGWEFFQLAQSLEGLVGCKVDVATRRSLRPSIRDNVLRETVYA